jgi:membrane protease YdiL (CAAX protease family)
MSAETLSLLSYLPFAVLFSLPLFALTWFATRHRKLEDPKIAFRSPRKEAILSLVIVALVALMLTGYIYFRFQLNGGGALGTPSDYTLQMALLQWFGMGVMFLIPIVAIVKARRQTLAMVGLTKKNPGFSIGLGLLLGVVFAVIQISASGITGNLTAENVAFGFIYFLAVGFMEELLMRGYLQTRCVSWLGASKNLIVASVIMAFYHLPHRMFAVGFDPLQAVISAVELLPISFAFGFLMLRTKNVLGPPLMHTLVDWIPSII